MKYDLKAMDFDVEEARAALEDVDRVFYAFNWAETTAGEDFWCRVLFGHIPETRWHPKVKAMIAQWEEENA